MSRSKLYPIVTCLLVMLASCGGGGGDKDKSPQATSDYKLNNVQQASNQISTTLSSLITGVSGQSPTITSANCDGSSTQPVSFSMWVGDYAALALSSDNIMNVAQMTTRQQIFFSSSQKYTTLLTLTAADTSINIPKGTQEVWYEFYCNTGTLSAGKVAV